MLLGRGLIERYFVSQSVEISQATNWIALIVGPFIGAFAAFLSNRILDTGRRHREQIVAANLALLTIKNQYNDYLMFRKDFREDVAREGLVGNEPIWALTRPSFMTFGEYELDFKSIGFLFECSGNGVILDKAELSQIIYRDMVAICKSRNETAVEIQKTVMNSLKKNPNATWDYLAHEIGDDTTALMSTIAKGLAIRSERNEKVFLDAFNNLHSALNSYLHSYWLDRAHYFLCLFKRPNKSKLIKLDTPKKKFLVSELPALPEILVAEIEKIPAYQ
jgi:hypothetical protein